jgi:hypothetical protein
MISPLVRCVGRTAVLLTIVLVTCALSAAARADEPYFAGWGANVPKADIRAGGVIDVSYNYHQQPTSGNGAVGHELMSPSPWYGWGFPVQTYRWGWFGAQHYYPRVFCHEGYHGDYCRFAYRCGY